MPLFACMCFTSAIVKLEDPFIYIYDIQYMIYRYIIQYMIYRYTIIGLNFMFSRSYLLLKVLLDEYLQSWLHKRKRIFANVDEAGGS